MAINKLILQEAKVIQNDLIEIRRELHRHPEIGFDLEVTLPYVMAKLRDYGYEPRKCGKAGITATVGNGKGKTFLLRADMDALPIMEETKLPYKSSNKGKMHACGHDMHTTMLLGAARILKKHEKEIEGTVKLMFQPAEEIMLGAHDMIEAGVLENPAVDAGMMIHVMPAFPCDDGTVVISNTGKAMASCDWYEIKVIGKSGHGSTPSDAIDPIGPAANIHLALMEIQSREVAAGLPFALTTGEFHAGNTSNVIPTEAILRGTLRTYDDELRANTKERMVEIAQSIGKAYRCEVDVTFLAGAPTNKNDDNMVAAAKEYLPLVFEQNKIIAFDDFPVIKPLMGSEDFAYVSQKIPTVSLFIGASDSRLSEPYPVHHPKLVLNEDILSVGAAAHVTMALNWLHHNK